MSFGLPRTLITVSRLSGNSRDTALRAAALPAGYSVLSRPGFEGALEEFTKALSHARDGNTNEAATEATKAIESTMKYICDVRGWKYARDGTATTLFKVVTDQGPIPHGWSVLPPPKDGHLVKTLRAYLTR
jgi:hypothetical protein